MTIRAIDHFTLRTRALEQTVAFYREVVGLQEGVRPPFPFAGRWLYADGRPLLHLVASGTDEGLASYLGVRGELQLFLQDNNGVMVELLFLDDTSQEDKR